MRNKTLRTDTRLIKRYDNRKMYDTYEKGYTTLENMSEVLSEGIEIQVIDNKTKKDITNQTKLNIIFMKQLEVIDKVSASEQSDLFSAIIRSKGSLITNYVAGLKGVGIERLRRVR